MQRKRGAQPGNKNALIHGFYSRHFKAEENRILSQMSLTDPSGEIELMRVQNDRFMEFQNTLPHPLDLEAQLSVLRAVTLSTESINSMIRTQIVLAQANGESDEIIRKLTQIATDAEKDDPETPLQAD